MNAWASVDRPSEHAVAVDISAYSTDGVQCRSTQFQADLLNRFHEGKCLKNSCIQWSHTHTHHTLIVLDSACMWKGTAVYLRACVIWPCMLHTLLAFGVCLLLFSKHFPIPVMFFGKSWKLYTAKSLPTLSDDDAHVWMMNIILILSKTKSPIKYIQCKHKHITGQSGQSIVTFLKTAIMFFFYNLWSSALAEMCENNLARHAVSPHCFSDIHPASHSTPPWMN